MPARVEPRAHGERLAPKESDDQPPEVVTLGRSNEIFQSIASNGSSYLVWESPSVATRLDRSADVLPPAGVSLTAPAGQVFLPVIASDGGDDDSVDALDAWLAERASSAQNMTSSTGEDFEEATRVTGGAGIYAATVSPAWEIWGPNGGYMATIALRAAGAEARIPNPASFYCQFLRVARFDAIEARVTVVQQGRRSESLRVSLIQDGKPVLEGLLRTAVPGDGLEHTDFTVPEVPPPEALMTLDELWRPEVPRFRFWDNLEARVILPERFKLDRAAMPPHWLEWYRFRPRPTFTDPFVNAGRALMLVDTLGWPAVWLRHPDAKFRAPSLDVVTFFHAPATSSEWLLCEQECPQGRGGLLSPRARVFDRDGSLVASGGTQLLCVPVPAG